MGTPGRIASKKAKIGEFDSAFWMRMSFVDWNINAATDLYIDQWLKRIAACLFAARYKRTECEPLQFGRSRERIAAANAENLQM